MVLYRKFFLLLLSLLVFFNLILFFIYLNKKGLKLPIFSSNHVKSFIDNSNYFPISINTPIENSSKTSKTYIFNAIIDSNLFFDKRLNGYILPLRFSSNKTSKPYYLYFEINSKSIPVLFAKNGIIPDIQQWESLDISKIKQKFQANNPIIFEVLTFSEKDFNLIKTVKKCFTGPCLEGIKFDLHLFKNVQNLYERLKNNISINNTEIKYIGYPTLLIIYD